MSKFIAIWRFGIGDTKHRWARLLWHMVSLFTFKSQIPKSAFYDWPVDLAFYILDVFYVPEIHMSFLILLKPGMRHLTDLENILVEEWFADSIQASAILINDNAWTFVRKYAYAFVGYNVVNYRHKIETAILVHELVHVYQFQKFGSVYIYRALKAQNSKYKYDYGGVSQLVNGLNKGKTLFHYNFEQQAMIIEDYYRMNHEFQLFSDGYSREIYRTYYMDMVKVS